MHVYNVYIHFRAELSLNFVSKWGMLDEGECLVKQPGELLPNASVCCFSKL